MASTAVVLILALAFIAIVIAYLWPRPEVRLEKLFVATSGAVVGGLIARVVSDARGAGLVVSVAAGAFAFSTVDWMIRGRHKVSSAR